MAETYSSYGNGALAAYPSPLIDPREKGFEWIRQYAKAAYYDSRGFMPFGQLNTGTLRMAELKLYALGKQPVDKYKKMFSPGNPSDESWRAIDWTVPAFMCKFREIALSKLIQRKYDIQAYPVDPLAKQDEDDYLFRLKTKLLMRQMAAQQESELANSPALQPDENEPQDWEEFQIKSQYGFKHQMSVEAENAINLVFEQNGIDELCKITYQNLYDYGIGGITQHIDENGKVKLRAINPERLGMSYCEKPDFSDMVHWFEIVPTYIADIAPFYTKDQLDDICKKAVSRDGNPSDYAPVSGFFNPAWNRFKVMVMKIKFLSWNDTIFEERKDNRGNMRFGKTAYQNGRFVVNRNGKIKESEDGYFAPMDENESKGEAEPKYMKNTRKVVYKASWIVDTEYMHDYGLQENQNRKMASWCDTDLDVQIYAWNFYRMQFGGITERLVPLEDRACMAWFNLQNLSNKLIPYLINIDFNAIEAVNFGKGGQKAKPAEIMEFIFSNFVAPYRSTDLLTRNPNYKPVSIESTGQLAAFAQLYDELNHTIEMMRQISGLNELTDGSTPNERTLVPVAQAAIQSTNNAIYLINDAYKNIHLRTADAVMQKVQLAVKMGKVQGYAKALGSNTVKFFEISKDICLYDMGIFIEEAPSDELRAALWQDINIKENQGFITIGDKGFLMTCRNIKEAYEILDHRIQKRKEEAQQFEMQKIQEQGSQNQQVAAVSEQMKQQTIQMQGEIDLQKIAAQAQANYIIEAMKKQSEINEAHIQAQAKILANEILANAKVHSQAIAAGSHERGKHIDAIAGIEGRKIDMQKAKKAASK